MNADGVDYVASSILVSGSTVAYTFGTTFTYLQTLTFRQMRSGANDLKDSQGRKVEDFATDVLIALTNNISGPVTVKANLTRFANSTSATGWINLDTDWGATGVKSASMTSTTGSLSGVGLSVTDAFPSLHINSSTACNSGCTYGTWTSPSASISEIPDSNISIRSPVAETGGATGAFQFTGLSAGQTYDLVLYQFVDDDGFPDGGSGTVVVTNGAGTSNASVDLTSDRRIKTTFTGLTASGSGTVTVTYTLTGGAGQVGAFAFEFTKYP